MDALSRVSLDVIVRSVSAQLPAFDLKDSGLLRGLHDGTIGQVWEFWNDGAYPNCRDLKAEADLRVEEVLSNWSVADLVELAKEDTWVMAGFLDGGQDDSRDLAAHRHRRLAMRVVDIGLEQARFDLDRKALMEDPRRSDRVFEVVPGLWEALADRHYLLPITPERAPTDVLSAEPFFTLATMSCSRTLTWPARGSSASSSASWLNQIQRCGFKWPLIRIASCAARKFKASSLRTTVWPQGN